MTIDQRNEKIELLAQQLHAERVRSAKLESSNGALARANANMIERLALAEASADGKGRKQARGR